MNDNIPTLTTAADAQALLAELAETHDWVSVFWDRGWGDSGQTAEISIIVDGDGQNPKANITKPVYAALIDSRAVAANSLHTMKARRLHDYKTPSVPEQTGPTSQEIAETVIRDLIEAHNDLPIVAEFCGGSDAAEYSGTDAADAGWYVLLLPGCSDVAMSAQEPTFLGPRIIGGGVARCLAYPTSGGNVDLSALAGESFRNELLAAIREKAAVIEGARASS